MMEMKVILLVIIPFISNKKKPPVRTGGYILDDLISFHDTFKNVIKLIQLKCYSI